MPPSAERRLQPVQDPGPVWHIGFGPDAWAWVDWRYADQGHFGGRWDDPDGQFRTVYAGSSAYACFVEVLAKFRPHPTLVAELAEIADPDGHDVLHPTHDAGTLGQDWPTDRLLASATLSGRYCAVTTAGSVAVLRAEVGPAAHLPSGVDFDTALLKDATRREVTQQVARWLYEQADSSGGPDWDGVAFASRHGDDLALHAVFERPGDPGISPRLDHLQQTPIDGAEEALAAAMRLHGLRWATH